MIGIMELVILIIITVLAGLYGGLWARGVDRKIAAWFQSRIGPPLRQPFWDLKKLMLKQTIVPENAVVWVFRGAPLLALASSVLLLIYIWVPYFFVISGVGDSFFLKSGDLILILYLLMIPAIALIAGGFSAGSPLSTIGAQREMVILISTELPLAIIIVALATRMGILAPGYPPFAVTTVASHPFWSGLGPVGIIGGILLLSSFLVIIPAELAKIPFDQAEAETEIAGGLLAEYSGRDFAFFQLAESVKALAVVSLAVVLFFPQGFTVVTGYIIEIMGVNLTPAADLIFFILKIFIIYSFSITAVRVSMARFRISQVSKILIITMTIISLSGYLMIYLDPALVAM